MNKDNIDKDIYFLDNYESKEYLKEINQSNTEIYLDNKSVFKSVTSLDIIDKAINPQVIYNGKFPFVLFINSEFIQ